MLSPLKAPDGILVTAAIRDISVRKAAERHLVQMEQRYRGLLEAAPDAMVVVNQAGEIVLLNVRAENQFGYRRDELLGQKMTNIIPEGFAERLIADALRSVEDARAQQIGTGIELHGRHRNGSTFPIEIMLSPLESAEGILVTAAIRDISVRKKMEEASFGEKERLRLQSAALESTADGVMITECDGTITWVNPAFCRITGFTATEAAGCKPSIFRSSEHDDAFYGQLWRTILDGQVWDGELTNRRKDGQLYLEALTITPVRDSHGAISHFVSVKRDVSHRRRLEEQLRQSQKMEAVGRLAGGVAHDFNNILGVIMGYGEILRRRIPDGDPLQGKVAEILKAAERAAALTRQLLAFSRKQVLQPRVLDLNVVVADMDEMLRRLIGEDIALKMSLREPLGSVRADPGQLEQVLMNLVVNARDAMPGAGSLLIETAEVDLDASALALHPGARPGPLRPAGGQRHRRRAWTAETDLAHLRAVLHDQGARGGHGPGPVHGLRDRRAERRTRRRVQRAGTRHDLQGLPAAHRRRGGAGGSAGGAAAAPRGVGDDPARGGRAGPARRDPRDPRPGRDTGCSKPARPRQALLGAAATRDRSTPSSRTSSCRR